LHADSVQLRTASELFEGGPRPLPHASVLEDLGGQLLDDQQEADAIAAYDRALKLYTAVGATWDSQRLRSRLRSLGVRRRLVATTRPGNGWESLTESELSVVRKVAEGLTNREVAAQLFVSPHTVGGHLRHAFLKLAINSRVELTRLVVAHESV